MMKRALLWLATAIVAALTYGSATALPLYHLTTLNSQSESWNQAYDINDHGVVVGETLGPTAFVWDGTHAVERLTVPTGYLTSTALAINNSGQVAGWAMTQQGERAVLWDTDGMIDLEGVYTGQADNAFARAINDGGKVVGRTGTSSYTGFLWSKDVGMTSLGAHTWAEDINNDGVIVGGCGVSTAHAAVWMPGHAMQDIVGLPGSVGSSAVAVNNLAQVVGWSQFRDTPDPWRRGFVWTESGGFTEIPALAGASEVLANDINDAGVVVGSLNYGTRHNAFIWTPQSGTVDLESLLDSPLEGWRLYIAYGINNVGQIVGYAASPTGQTQTFLLTPVPEPASLLALLCGIGALSLLRRRTGLL